MSPPNNPTPEEGEKRYTIKPLEWEANEHRGQTAQSAFTTYTVFNAGWRGGRWGWDWTESSVFPCDDLAHGKALAEQHYRSRMESGLEEVK